MSLRGEGEKISQASAQLDAARAAEEASENAPFVPDWFGELLSVVRRAGIDPVGCYVRKNVRKDPPNPLLLRRHWRHTVTCEYLGDRWFLHGYPGSVDEYGSLVPEDLSFDAEGRFWKQGSRPLQRRVHSPHGGLVVIEGLREGPARSVATHQKPLTRYFVEADEIRTMCAVAVHRITSGEAEFAQPGVVNIGSFGR